ncbi:MAG: hypothetical protein U5J97_10750 [Trueperaceae bacterium]|nr:hypothetical protein [Trueperaceae bacterium]
MLAVLAAAPRAEAACPVPEQALGSPIAQRFSDYLNEHFPMLRGDRSLSDADRAILVGYALGRQAPAVGDDPARRDAFDCLLVALEHATYWQALASGPAFGFAMAADTFRTMYAAAMGMYDDRVSELTGYTPDTELPNVFDVDTAVAGGPDPFDPVEMDAFRDGLLADGFGPDYGPNGGGCPPEPGATPDYLYTVVPYPHQLCWAFGDAVWCCGNYRWTSVARTDGLDWAITDLRGGPSCAFTTTWQGDDGYSFGGTARCPDDREFGWNVRIVQ